MLEEDIAPAVFARFLERRPELATLFGVMLPGHLPVGCGSMVFEILCLLRDGALGESYVGGYLEDLVDGHRQFGVERALDYSEFLDTIEQVVVGMLGISWPEAERTAWARQTRALQQRIGALARPAR